MLAFFGANGIAANELVKSFGLSSDAKSVSLAEVVPRLSMNENNEGYKSKGLQIDSTTTKRLQLAENLAGGSRISSGLSLNISDNSSRLQMDERNILNSNNSQDTIKQIYNEVGRESDINAIQKESQKSFEETIDGKDLIEYIKSLKEARDKIQEWRRQGGLGRSLENVPATTSTIEQKGRNSLRELYIIHAKLQEIKNKLIQKLKDTSQNTEVHIEKNIIEKDKHNWQDVQSALRWIEWDESGKIKFRVKYLDKEQKVVYSPQDKESSSYGWGSWDKNPFRIFFKDEEEYKFSMKRLEQAENSLKKFLAAKSMMVNFKEIEIVTDEDLRRIEGKESEFHANVSEAILDLEMQVANKLIEWTLPESTQKKILS